MTSTRLFTNTVGSASLKVDYSFFSAPGVPACKSTNAASFTPANNAWNVVADFRGDEGDQTPFLFTRNLDIENLAQLPPTRDASAYISSGTPFGGDGVVTINKGGSGQIYFRNIASLSTDFNRFAATNKVLRTGFPMPLPVPLRPESNPENRGKPEFAITDIRLDPVHPKTNDTFKAEITIHNRGSADGNPGTLTVWIDHRNDVADGAGGVTNVPVDDIQKGKSIIVPIGSLTAPDKKGDYHFRAYIDTSSASKNSKQRGLPYSCVE